MAALPIALPVPTSMGLFLALPVILLPGSIPQPVLATLSQAVTTEIITMSPITLAMFALPIALPVLTSMELFLALPAILLLGSIPQLALVMVFQTVKLPPSTTSPTTLAIHAQSIALHALTPTEWSLVLLVTLLPGSTQPLVLAMLSQAVTLPITTM